GWMPFATTLSIELFRDTTTILDGLQHGLPHPPTVGALPADDNHFVRVSLNNQTIKVPTCAANGKHHPKLGTAYCSLPAFFEHLAQVIPADGELDAECGTKPEGFKH
ncbi:hypothetical protein LPJ61_003955, partial [Coemansia biformis]